MPNSESEIWLYHDLTQMIPAHANETTSVSPREARFELSECRGGPGLLGPSSLASTGTFTHACSTHRRTSLGWQCSEAAVAACSTAPLPRMQCDTRHWEMAVKVQEKNTVIYGLGICCQIRNRDLISSKSSSLYESRWGGVCNAKSCSTLNLLLFLISRSHLQSRHLSWPWCQEPWVGGRGDENVLLLDGWLFPSCNLEPSMWEEKVMAKSKKETMKKGTKEKFQSKKTTGWVKMELGLKSID